MKIVRYFFDGILTVGQDVASLEQFVWNTVHRQFYERRQDWFERHVEMHLAMWWVTAGHRPTLDEAMQRLQHLRAHGDSDHAFGWAHLEDAQLWRARNCNATAAE